MTGSNGIPHEPRFRFDPADLESLLSEWRALGRDCLDTAEQYARQRPAESLVIAFLAGALLGALMGRR